VEFDRRPFEQYPLRALVISWNVELTLVQVLDTDSFQLEGYAVFRNSDMRRWRAIPAEDSLARVAALRKLHPSKPDRVGIASMKEAVASAGAAFPLITIYRERLKRRVCNVGRLVRLTQRTMTIRSITPQAELSGKKRTPIL